MISILGIIERRTGTFFFRVYQRTYSQLNEDLVIRHIFNLLKIEYPAYLDITAHHPTHLNNPYKFYKTGSSGVCVEPDSILYRSPKLVMKEEVVMGGFSYRKSRTVQIGLLYQTD